MQKIYPATMSITITHTY